ncbi:MAG: hypothetical protein Q8Q95_00635 [bacterium]|nr:hypothetical protein [bacterium]
MKKKATCAGYTLFCEPSTEHFGFAKIQGNRENYQGGYPLRFGPLPLFRRWLKEKGIKEEIQEFFT